MSRRPTGEGGPAWGWRSWRSLPGGGRSRDHPESGADLPGSPEQALVTLPGAAMPTTAATGACRSWAASPNWSGTFSRPARATSSAVSDAPNAREGWGLPPSRNRERHVHPAPAPPGTQSREPWPQALPPPRGRLLQRLGEEPRAELSQAPEGPDPHTLPRPGGSSRGTPRTEPQGWAQAELGL